MTRQVEGKRGRVTEKGTAPISVSRGEASADSYEFNEPSPLIVPIVMFGSLILGILVILVNYIATIDFLGMPDNWYLLGGLGLVLVGIITATRLR